MTVADQQGEQEKASAERIIASNPPFEGVQSMQIELGEDHTGDPAMWVVFTLRRDLKADESWMDRFNDYSTKLGLKLIEHGITRFPHTRLERAA